MSELLIFCTMSKELRQRLDASFDTIDWQDGNADALLDMHADNIKYAFTDGGTTIPSGVIERLPALEFISNLGVGYDGVDTGVTNARGIIVSHTPSVLDQEVATTAVMLFLACWRNFEAQMTHARTGRWATDGNLPLSRTADGRTIGILGLGRIGKAIAAKLAPWSPTVLYHGRSEQDVPYQFMPDLVEMAKSCDTLINVAPGGEATHHLIDHTVLKALGPDGILINVGRGSTVDEDALTDALESGLLGMAGLDVFQAEPHIPARLRALKNVVLLPHVASASIETRGAMADLAINNLLSWRDKGKALSPIPECLPLLRSSD